MDDVGGSRNLCDRGNQNSCGRCGRVDKVYTHSYREIEGVEIHVDDVDNVYTHSDREIEGVEIHVEVWTRLTSI